MRRHVLAVCIFCGVSDAVLILCGVAGVGTLADRAPWFEPAMRYGGAVFLFWYGWKNARSAWVGGSALNVEDVPDVGLWRTLATLAAITYLNPHVYLDTVVLVGAISAQYEHRYIFGLGGALGSITFFFALGYGARLLAPWFRTPKAWQILDAIIAITMWTIAISLLLY